VQPVRAEQLDAGMPVFVQHRPVGIDVGAVGQSVDVARNQPVGGADLVEQVLTRRAGLDRDEVDAHVRQLGPDGFLEANETFQHLQWRLAFGQVVVSRVDQHLLRPVAHHQLPRQQAAVGEGGAPETAVDDHRHLPEVLRQIGPQPNGRAAHEQHAVIARKVLLVGVDKVGQRALPARIGGYRGGGRR